MLPMSMGTKIKTMFCIKSFPMGRLISIPDIPETILETKSMMMGSVKSVMILLIAVSVTDKAILPLASIEKTLEELPPGQHATKTNPIK